jgi:hypothetical protein
MPSNNTLQAGQSPERDAFQCLENEEVRCVSMPEINISLSEFVWSGSEDFQVWDCMDLEAPSALPDSRHTSNIELSSIDFDPSSAIIPISGPISHQESDNQTLPLQEKQQQQWDSDFLNCKIEILYFNSFVSAKTD